MGRVGVGLVLLGLLSCAHSGPRLEDIRAAEFVLPTVDGQAYGLESQRGRVVLVSFFATWCFPCVAETGMLKSLSRKHPRDLSVVGVGMDLAGNRVLKPFRDEMSLPYTVLVADKPTIDGMGPFGSIRELPTTFVIDRQGVVRGGFVGVPDEGAVERVLAPLF